MPCAAGHSMRSKIAATEWQSRVSAHEWEKGLPSRSVEGHRMYRDSMIESTQVTEAQQDRMALAAQMLIAEIWVAAMKQGFDGGKAARQGASGRRLLWALWDECVPKPNPITMPLWYLACEGGLMEVSRNFSFIVPTFPSLPFMSVRDHGCDSFWSGRIVRQMTTPKRLMSNTDRARSRESIVDEHPLACHVESDAINFKPVVSLREHKLKLHRLLVDGLLESRRALLRHVLTWPKLPVCEHRLMGSPGLHLCEWLYKGLAVRGLKPLLWSADSASASIAGLFLKKVPMITPPVWFGFTESGEETGVRAWCESYREHRNAGIEEILSPGNMDSLRAQATRTLGTTLDLAGRLMQEGKIKPRTSRDVKQTAFESLFNSLGD